MARLPRIHVPGGWYYVSVRSRRQLFVKPADFWLLERLVAIACQRTGVQVHGFCWLIEGLRLLVQVQTLPVATFMHYVGSGYAHVVRQRSQTAGRLFAGRYEALLLDVDQHFMDVLCEIHLEPLRAGVVSDAGDYCWSSHRSYLGVAMRPWLCVSFGLRLLHAEPERARELYRSLLGRHSERPSACLQSLSIDSRVVGDRQFLSALVRKPEHNERLVQVVDEVCREECVTVDALRSRAQSRWLSRARASIAARALQDEIASLSEVARYLNRSPSALARAAQRHTRKNPQAPDGTRG